MISTGLRTASHLTHRASLERAILITAVSVAHGVACRWNLSNNKITYICQRDWPENILLKLVCQQFQEIIFPLADTGGGGGLQGASAPHYLEKFIDNLGHF